MRVLVIGLGSMGKRRVRNLQALDVPEIAGFDVRDDRRAEASRKYHITTFDDFETALYRFKPNVMIISTPPDQHIIYAEICAERYISCFIEASVVEADRLLELYRRTESRDLLIAPSCTMRYFPGPKKVKEIIRGGAIGRPLTLNYQVGQYLPDWHPWERIEDFYVSRRETGGCREIVPFELTWLNDLFGTPTALACVKAKLSDIPADIDDIYQCLLRYPEGLLASLTVEVLSRPTPTRELRVLGTNGELSFSGDENCVRFISTESSGWTRFDLIAGTFEAGYINPEEPYIAEIGDFLQAVSRRNKNLYPSTLFEDYQTLKVLCQLERLSEIAH